MWNKFKYLGFDKLTIKKCQAIIDKDNIKTVKDVSILLLLIVSTLLIFYVSLDSDNIVRIILCLISTIVLIGVYIISKKILEQNKRCTSLNANIIINFLFLICFLVAIYLGTYAAIDEMAVAPVWMFFFAILIFNRFPMQNLMTLVLYGGVFLVCSYMLKRPFLFQYDAMHAITSIIASVYVSWVKSKMKVENTISLMELKKENHKILESVEEQVKETEILRYKATMDELTGFYKKKSFENIISRIIEYSNDSDQHALICCDLDDFKSINDKFGHMYGDQVLRDCAKDIVDGIGMNCLFGRFGGDEFMIFVENVQHTDEVLNQIYSMKKQCEKEYCKGELKQGVSLSCGCAFYPSEGNNYNELFEYADKKLYQEKKEKGKK